jgi:hypothetical protein
MNRSQRSGEVENTERRVAERRPAGDNLASLLWDDGQDVMESPALLIDISRDGASFLAERSPPSGRDICMRLEAPSRTGWVSVRVVRSNGAMEGGLSFSGHFSHHLIPGLI